MSVLRSVYMTNVRNQADATGSPRWSDTEVRTALGIAGLEAWSAILGANPYYKFAQRSVTANALGQFTWASLSSGSGDTAQNLYRLLAMTDGSGVVYRQSAFMDTPLGTATNAVPNQYLWYDAGDNVQILPVAPTALTVSVNYTPPSIDSLSADTVAVDFPVGHEAVVFLNAAAFLLDKGGAESDAAGALRASAFLRLQMLLQDLSRRAAQPMMLSFPDRASDWGG